MADLENPSSDTSLVDNDIHLDATSSNSEEDNSFFTCEICVELVPLNLKFKNIEITCSHNYCSDCIAKYIKVKVSQDNTSQIKCPNTNCSVVLDTLSCRSILSEKVFERWCRVHCESAVLLESSKGGFAYGRSYCPYRDCSELILNECVETSQSTKLTKSNCPSCKKLFCFHCMVPWKEDHRCTNRSEIIIDLDSNDILFIENVKHNKWARCPTCYHYVERNQGCSAITCRCKTRFCYNCGEKACVCKIRLHWWQNIMLGMYTLVFMPLMVVGLIHGLIHVGATKLFICVGVGLFCALINIGAAKLFIYLGVLPLDNEPARGINTIGRQQQDTPAL